MTIHTGIQALQWWEWRAESKGKSPWEVAQVAAFEVLSKICQQHGDELIANAVGTFPQVNPSVKAWLQTSRNALVQDRDERAQSLSPAMSAMFAIM